MLEERSAPEYDNTILELRARVEALEGKYETMRLATLEWGKDVDTHARLIDKLWKRVEALEAAQQQPEPQGPTDEEVYDLADVFNGDPVPAIRRALELWGRPAIEPETDHD